MVSNENNNVVEENVLLAHLKQVMKLNIEAELYTDATFFADKIVNLVVQPTNSYLNPVGGATGMSENSKSSVNETTAQAIYDLGKSNKIHSDFKICSQLLLVKQRVPEVF